MNAYSELYVNDAKKSLSQFFSYLIDECGIEPEMAWAHFKVSGYAERFEKGNPGVISGMSGIELARAVLSKTYGDNNEYSDIVKEPELFYMAKPSPAYWAGWVLAEYQWYTGRRFSDIFEAVPLKEVIAMYSVYHEMDVSQFFDEMDSRIEKAMSMREPKIKRIRENRGISQSELAKMSGVKLRSIQMYEQKNNDIDKAQGQTLYKLSRVLGCKIEDLLEDPSQ